MREDLAWIATFGLNYDKTHQKTPTTQEITNRF